jgi:hypothetical protein
MRMQDGSKLGWLGASVTIAQIFSGGASMSIEAELVVMAIRDRE